MAQRGAQNYHFMKHPCRLPVYLVFFLPFWLSAQTSTRPDTVRVPDPSVPGLEHWIIHGYLGALKMQGDVLNGKLEGVWREYNEGTGQMTRLEEYTQDVRDGVALHFAPNGTLTTDETYVNGKLNGYRTTYGNNGRIKTSEYYVDGLLEGIRKTYYENSHVQEKGNWSHGERDGSTVWFLQSGYPYLEYTYKNGQLEGPSVSYDEKGVKTQEGMFRNNKEDGEWKYYADSVLVRKVLYKAGAVVREIPVKK
jgi:antitoxin component YwqK of YwqJK toxin-antitoxin module